jgi:hypothetical protein
MKYPILALQVQGQRAGEKTEAAVDVSKVHPEVLIKDPVEPTSEQNTIQLVLPVHLVALDQIIVWRMSIEFPKILRIMLAARISEKDPSMPSQAKSIAICLDITFPLLTAYEPKGNFLRQTV